MKSMMLLIVIQLLIFPIFSHSKIITIHQTNTHTVQEFITQFETTLITRWSTLQRFTEEPESTTTTTTTTITRTITTTMGTDSTTSTPPSSTISSPSTSIITSSTSTISSLSFESNVVSLHNTLRSKHSAQPLKWSTNLTNFAINYANSYNCNGTLIHSHSQYGENLALGYNTTAAIQAWYNEEKDYNYNDPVFSEKTGHFTQLVWNSSTLIGCAIKDCGDYFGEYLVCEYQDAGNVAGQFADNVFAS